MHPSPEAFRTPCIPYKESHSSKDLAQVVYNGFLPVRRGRTGRRAIQSELPDCDTKTRSVRSKWPCPFNVQLRTIFSA